VRYFKIIKGSEIMFEIFSIVPTSLIVFWAFFVFLCVAPMILAIITDKKDKERMKNMKSVGGRKE
jgi:hypothetical protein